MLSCWCLEMGLHLGFEMGIGVVFFRCQLWGGVLGLSLRIVVCVLVGSDNLGSLRLFCA